MIALIQRVSEASVQIGAQRVAHIGEGVLALIGIAHADEHATAERLLERVLGYRVFADADGRMNRSLRETGGGLLLVPQFTLAADTRKGTRAGGGAIRLPAGVRTQRARRGRRRSIRRAHAGGAGQ
jgi:D-tyrosyl-tRNA(Tyr) deacylase